MNEVDKICLYRITHIENIPHILQYGIVHNLSPDKNNNYISIGDRSLIDYRDSKKVYVGDISITLGDFIPFYFGIRMPMLYVIQRGGNFVERPRRADEIVYVAVSMNSIIKNDFTFYFSDGHATDYLTSFYDKNSINDISSILDWNAIKAKIWSGDGIETDVKRKKQAEFLVKEDVPASFIVGYVCYNDIAKSKLISFGIEESKIKIKPDAYY